MVFYASGLLSCEDRFGSHLGQVTDHGHIPIVYGMSALVRQQRDPLTRL